MRILMSVAGSEQKQQLVAGRAKGRSWLFYVLTKEWHEKKKKLWWSTLSPVGVELNEMDTEGRETLVWQTALSW